MAWMAKVASTEERREHYRENMLLGFDALSDLYYTYWGEFFHLALFEPGDDRADLAAAYQRTHERYLEAVGGAACRRILDVACGGGALSAWLADHTGAEVVGVDLSGAQLSHARRWVAGGRRPNLLATVASYTRSFAAAGLRIRRVDDLSDDVVPNWERGYRAALRALAEPIRLGELLRLAAVTAKHGPVAVRAAKDQFQVALLARAAADSGLLRYVSVLGELRPA
jgi:SAM-dependent methyltransferase